ncbi:magnesium-dependent phosphatase-1 [Gautieria morchelliformis]|nr:magnesium-dependent phosphatase-1 [Gautieria morchelliformis]
MAVENRVPQLIAFDLDYTLWDFYIDSHVTGPLNSKGSKVQDIYGTSIEFYPDVPQILNKILSFEGPKIAACSRTHASALARDALSLIRVPLTKGDDGGATEAVNFFDQMEIYPGSKITHFKELHRKTGIPYTEMLFFDDERRNAEVESLGVTFVLVQNGLDIQSFEEGLTEWRNRHATEL